MTDDEFTALAERVVKGLARGHADEADQVALAFACLASRTPRETGKRLGQLMRVAYMAGRRDARGPWTIVSSSEVG